MLEVDLKSCIDSKIKNVTSIIHVVISIEKKACKPLLNLLFLINSLNLTKYQLAYSNLKKILFFFKQKSYH